MGARLQDGDGAQVEGAASCGFKCADTAFAKDDALVAAGDYVFGGQQEFLHRSAQPSLQEYGAVDASQSA